MSSDIETSNDPWVDGPETEWAHSDDKTKPGTVSVQPAASNAYGPPIYLHVKRGEESVGIWLDLETWEQMYQAGLEAHALRVQATQAGWT